MLLKHLRPYQLRQAVADDRPLLVPTGCVETHGPHMAIGHDTIIVEEICERIARRMDVVIAPPFDFGPTGYALGGAAEGTIIAVIITAHMRNIRPKSAMLQDCNWAIVISRLLPWAR